MKRSIFISFIMAIAFFINCNAMPAHATEKQIIDTTIEYFEDGSYAVITIIEELDNSRATVKSGSKVYTYSGSNGETLWTYKITGTFSYTGSTSTCTAVSDSYTISNDNWHMSSHSCSRSGNTANGTVTMKYKFLGITTDTVTKNLSLSCSASGTLS